MSEEDILVSKITPEQRRELMRDHHERILKGEISLGPPGHASDPLSQEPVEDRRDLRDPRLLGNALLVSKEVITHGHAADLSKIYDAHSNSFKKVYNFSPHQSATDVTVPRYRQKMQTLAARGDLAATRVLLDHGWPLPVHMDQAILKRAREMRSAEAEVLPDAPVRRNNGTSA